MAPKITTAEAEVLIAMLKEHTHKESLDFPRKKGCTYQGRLKKHSSHEIRHKSQWKAYKSF